MVEKLLSSFTDYHLGNTPLYCATSYCKSRNLFVKLEQYNPLGSIKDRAAYFIIRDLIDTGKLKPGVKLVESSSGNLGLALNFFAQELGVDFVCLVDPTLPNDKIKQLESHNMNLNTVTLGKFQTFRDARIHKASQLDLKPNWIWTRQYDNPANVKSHYETTGPEIWNQTNNKVDYVISSIGTGGTICGIGLYLKKQNPKIKVVAIEPMGSTIFGGIPGCNLSVGAGMSCPSTLVRQYGKVIDFWGHVADIDALYECKLFRKHEDINIGITTGTALVVASRIAKENPDKIIVCIAPDGGEYYADLLKNINLDSKRKSDIALYPMNE
jgi:cysteine synthase